MRKFEGEITGSNTSLFNRKLFLLITYGRPTEYAYTWDSSRHNKFNKYLSILCGQDVISKGAGNRLCTKFLVGNTI